MKCLHGIHDCLGETLCCRFNHGKPHSPEHVCETRCPTITDKINCGYCSFRQEQLVTDELTQLMTEDEWVKAWKSYLRHCPDEMTEREAKEIYPRYKADPSQYNFLAVYQ